MTMMDRGDEFFKVMLLVAIACAISSYFVACTVEVETRSSDSMQQINHVTKVRGVRCAEYNAAAQLVDEYGISRVCVLHSEAGWVWMPREASVEVAP